MDATFATAADSSLLQPAVVTDMEAVMPDVSVKRPSLPKPFDVVPAEGHALNLPRFANAQTREHNARKRSATFGNKSSTLNPAVQAEQTSVAAGMF
jgi:hypothetical protein